MYFEIDIRKAPPENLENLLSHLLGSKNPPHTTLLYHQTSLVGYGFRSHLSIPNALTFLPPQSMNIPIIRLKIFFPLITNSQSGFCEQRLD